MLLYHNPESSALFFIYSSAIYIDLKLVLAYTVESCPHSHRHTNGTNFSRQACAEKIRILPDGSIPQAEMTSCGLNNGPLASKGEYPAYLACNLFCKVEALYTGGQDSWMDGCFPKITQDGRDGDEQAGYIANLQDGATAGFKYFDCKGIRKVAIKARGYGQGEFLVKLAWDGEAVGHIPVQFTNVWKSYTAGISIPDGIQALYFTFSGTGSISFGSFTLE